MTKPLVPLGAARQRAARAARAARAPESQVIWCGRCLLWSHGDRCRWCGGGVRERRQWVAGLICLAIALLLGWAFGGEW